MQRKYSLTHMIMALMLGAALLIPGPAGAFGRDDDKNKKGDRKSGKHQERGDRHSEREQKRSDRDSRRQQKQSDHSSRDQQRRSDWNPQMQQRRSDSESRRQQVLSDWNSRRQQERSDRDSRRERRNGDRRADRIQEVWNHGNQDDKRSRRRDVETDGRSYRDANRNVNRQQFIDRATRQPLFRSMFGGGQPFWRLGGDARQADKRFSKDERKAQRRYEKEQRRYEKEQGRDSRVYGPSLNGGYYSDNNYSSIENYFGGDNDFGGGSDWQQQILRLVIANVIGNRLGGDSFAADPRYSTAYQNQSLYRDSYNAAGYSQPYDNSYRYQADNGDDGDLPGSRLLSGGLLDRLPIAELIEQYTGGGGFASELVGNLLTQGYGEGLLAGQNARENGDEYYRDPYAYQGEIHDPYSASLGQSRRSLSEGYELGYADALNGDAQSGLDQAGAIDLVSLLIGNALGV